MPVELFDELVAHGLFAFDPEGFLEGGDVEPSFGLLALVDNAGAVGDEAIDERDLGAVGDAFHVVGNGDVLGHEDMGLNASGSGVGGERSCSVSGEGTASFFNP